MTLLESSPKPIVRLQRLLSASPQEVFDAWTDPESLQQWFCPGTVSLTSVELDARVGGYFRIVMRDETKDLVHTGEYREITPPQRLVFTWRSSGTYGEETLVTIELHPRGNKTELVLTHERLPDTSSAGKHEGGWQDVVRKLAVYLSTVRK
jgi:uncharacterized protein YndB with AHSA1/START domain